jgi:hypothetical protein
MIIVDHFSRTNGPISSIVRLAAHWSKLWNVRRFLRRSNIEDRRLPLITLGSKFLIFGGLCGDTARKFDAWEDRLIMSDCHVDLGIGNLSFSLLLFGKSLLLNGLDIAIVDVGSSLRISFSSFQCLLSFRMNLPGVCIGISKGTGDLLLQDLLNSRAHDLEEQWLKDTEEHLMIRLLELDVEVLHIDVDFVNLEEVLTITLVCVGCNNLEAEAISTEEDVHNTLVGDGWESLLALDVVGDI